MDSEFRVILSQGRSVIEIKKSRFIGEIKAVRSEDEAGDFIDSVRKTHYKAAHNCFAMRLGEPGSVLERSSDDGEPSGTAGRPILEVLRGQSLYDVCLVVTRYFGGTLLGTGGLERAYSEAAVKAAGEARSFNVKKGALLSTKCSYKYVDKVKREALKMGLFTHSEDYSDDCLFTYVVPREMTDSFGKMISRVSLGQSKAELISEVLYFGDRKPEIYAYIGEKR